MKRFARPILPALVLLGLPACVSVLPSPDTPDALYLIEPVNAAPLAASVTVREPEAPRIFAGQAIATEDGRGAVRLLPRAEWAGPATRQFQLALVESFAASGDGAAFLPEAGVAAPYEVSVRLSRLGLVPGAAVCDATATVLTTPSREAAAQMTVRERVDVADRASAPRARAVKQAAEACVRSIAEFVSTTLSD